MIAKLPHATVVLTRRVADAAGRAAPTISAELTAAWGRHRALAANNATYAAVLTAAAAWISGKLRWQDAILAILAALLGIAARNATARPRDARSWEQNGDYDFA